MGGKIELGGLALTKSMSVMRADDSGAQPPPMNHKECCYRDTDEALTLQEIVQGRAGSREQQAAERWLLTQPSVCQRKSVTTDLLVCDERGYDMRVGTSRRKRPGRDAPGSAARKTPARKNVTATVGRDVGHNKRKQKRPSRESGGKVGESEDSQGGNGDERRFAKRQCHVVPEGWTVEERKRTHGARCGAVDKFYLSPNGRRFRSYIGAKRYWEQDPQFGGIEPDNVHPVGE